MSIINNPDCYHGKYKKSNFFEGWYFKLVTEDNSRSIAFIIGISLSKNEEFSHSFIQILDGNNKTHNYIRYPKNSFNVNNSPLKINIDKNSFSLDGISLDIYEKDLTIKSTLVFKNIIKWKDSIINPGSMGFYNYIPFMECYSQVCALDGMLSGTLILNGEPIIFNNGKLYIEKNWGNSFPLEWLWIQCNTFEDKKATLTCSLGRVPFLNKSFQGFLICATINNKHYKFTTINKSNINISFDNGLTITAINKDIKLFFNVISNSDEFILCFGPKDGSMSPFVKESITSKIYMKIENLKTLQLLYEGSGLNTGLEYGGKFLNKFHTT